MCSDSGLQVLAVNERKLTVHCMGCLSVNDQKTY